MASRRPQKNARIAFRNRQEIIKARLTRRDLMKMGLADEQRSSDGIVLGTLPAGDGPSGVAFDGVNIWVAANGSNSISVLRPADGAVLAKVPVGQSPFGVEVSINLGVINIWVASFGTDSVALIDLQPLL